MTRTPPFVLLVSVCLTAACSHSASFSPIEYAPSTPFAPGPEAHIAGPTDIVRWTDDGLGMLYVGTCLTPETVRGRIPQAAAILLPASGGSSTWEYCEHNLAFNFPGDSAVGFFTAALDSIGRLVYVEAVTTIFLGGQEYFPVDTHTSLWLVDSATPVHPREVLKLYHDSGGLTVMPPDSVNWLTGLTWAGPTQFVAFGGNLTPRGFDYFTPLGLVRGTIAAAGATLTRLNGTLGARLFALTDRERTVVFTRDSLTVERIGVDGSGAGVVTTLPPAEGRSLVDLSCNDTLCLLLTGEVDSAAVHRVRSTFWTLTLSTGALQVLRITASVIVGAQLSPTSNLVLVHDSAGWSRYTDLLPAN